MAAGAWQARWKVLSADGHVAPITMTPVEETGKRFYRARGEARGAHMINRLGIAQAVDFGGCGGPL